MHHLLIKTLSNKWCNSIAQSFSHTSLKFEWKELIFNNYTFLVLLIIHKPAFKNFSNIFKSWILKKSEFVYLTLPNFGLLNNLKKLSLATDKICPNTKLDYYFFFFICAVENCTYDRQTDTTPKTTFWTLRTSKRIFLWKTWHCFWPIVY